MIDTKEFPMDHQQFCKWYKRHGGNTISFDAKDAIELDHIAALRIEARRNAPSQGHGLHFPTWVKVSPCKTRTFSIVLPGGFRGGGRHGAVRIEQPFMNRPTVTLPRIGLPGFYTGWADPK